MVETEHVLRIEPALEGDEASELGGPDGARHCWEMGWDRKMRSDWSLGGALEQS